MEQPTLGRREQRKRDTRRALERAALRLFARDGFEATSVEAIAAEAGVSSRTFFRYFTTKDEVLYVERERRQSLVRASLRSAPLTTSDLDAVHQAFVAIADDLQADREHILLQERAAATSPVLRGRLFDVLSSWERTIGAGLADRRGTTTDDLQVQAAAAAGMAAYRTAMLRWLAEPPPTRPVATHLDETFTALRATTTPSATTTTPTPNR